MSGSGNPFSDYIAQTEAKYGIPGGLLNNLLGVETGFTYSPTTYNASSGASGIAQVLPSTAADPGYGASPLANPWDPYASIDFAGQYLSGLYQSVGSWAGAVNAYGTTQPYGGSGGLTTAQSDLLAQAQSADLGGASSQWQNFLNKLFGGQFSLPTPGTSPATGKVVQPGGFVTGFWNEVGLRVVVAVIAVMLILVGAWSLANQQTIAATIKDAKGAAL